MASCLRFIVCLGVLLLAFGGWRSVQAAPPSYQAAGTAVSGTSSASPAWPAHAINDVALLFVETTGGQAATLSSAAGFVAVANSPQASGPGSAGTRLSVFWARATSISMSAPTITVASGDHVYAQILTYRNVYRYGNPWDITVGGVKASASTSLTVSSMSTTVSDTLVVQAATRDNDSSAAGFSAQSNASLASIVERSDAGTTSGNGGGFAVWDGQMTSAGATGSTTATVAISSINAFLSIALKPDVFEVSKAASIASVPINTNFTFTLSARNPVNAADQAGVIITDDLGAAGLNFSSCSTASGTCTFIGGVVTWNVGSVAAGSTKTATLTVNASSAGAKINTITSNVGTPVASASATVQAYAPLADWRMDEASWNGTANEVKDSSGGGYHGRSKVASGSTSVATTLTGSPAYTSGSQNTCRYGEFDKTTSPARSYSYVELTGLPALPSSFTFAVWIKSSNPSYVGQRILVRDDADNGWSFSLGDSGAARLRFFNRNISPSGSPIVIAGPGNGRNNLCGSVFCLDSDAVITAGNWFFVAVSIDTTGKVITNYLFDAAGTLVSSTSSAFTGTWKDGTGTAAIGGETSASGELPSNYHFQGNIDEMQIYSGVLSQADLSLLRTRSRTCGVSVDHYELSVPTGNLACLPSTVTVTACANASSPCTNPVTTISGQTATLSSGAATLGSSTVTFDASGVASTTLRYPSATNGESVTVTLSGEQATANNARQCCPNGSSCTVANSCTATFNTAGFIVSNAVGGSVHTVPTQTAGTASSTLYLRAVKTSTTTGACESALSGANTISWANQCNNPTTCDGTNRMSINGGTATTIQGNPNTGVSTYTPVAMTFDANGNAPFTFNYADAGQVTLYANKAAGGSLLTSLSGSSNAFVVRPASLAVSGVTTAGGGANPGTTTTAGAAFMAAGENFTVKVQGLTSGGAVTPNFGNETTVPAITFVNAANTVSSIYSLVVPSGGGSGVLTTGTSANGNGGGVTGTVVVSGNQWSEVGAFTLKPYLSNYLAGGSAVLGAESGTVGRFRPYQYGVAVAGGSGTGAICGSGNTAYAHIGQPLASTWTVTAQNKAGGTTSNYGRGTPTLVTLTTPLSQVTVNGLTAGLALDTTNALYSLAFATNQDFATRANGTAQIAAALPVRMNPTPAAPILSSLRIGGVTDEVGIVVGAPIDLLANATSTPTANQVNFELGRIRLDNAYGSELLDLPMTMRSEFWNGTGWVLNNVDTCTNATLAFAAVGTPNITGNTCVWDTGTAPGNSGVGCVAAPAAGRQYRETGVAGFAGDFNLWLRAPGAGNAGSIDVTATVPAWLQFNWRGAVANPTGRATFGVYRSPLIYRRENY